MVMKQPFTTASPIIATYDFNDIADGSGVVVFKSYVARNTAVTYNMDSRTNSTELIGTGSAVTTSKVEVFNLDFDSKKFNLSRTVKGTALVRIPIEVQVEVSDQEITISPVVNIYKWDGTTETLIGSTTALDRDSKTGAKFPTKTTMVEVECDRTFIPQGEQVRLNVIISAQITAGATDQCSIGIGHDPESNTFTYDGPATTDLSMTDTLMSLNLPFEVEA